MKCIIVQANGISRNIIVLQLVDEIKVFQLTRQITAHKLTHETTVLRLSKENGYRENLYWQTFQQNTWGSRTVSNTPVERTRRRETAVSTKSPVS